MPLFSDPAIPLNLDCGDPEYCHQFFPGDKIYTQFYQTPCGTNEMCDITFLDVTLGAELTTNGTFTGSLASWTATGNWVYGTNNAVCTAGSASELYQPIVISDGNYYRITFDLTRSAGSLRVVLGQTVGASASAYLDATGSYSIDLYYEDDPDDFILFQTDSDFDGTLDNVSVKQIDYACWTATQDWSLSSDGACKSVTGTDILTESVAAYTVANGYYQLSFTISGYISGTLVAKVAGVTDQDTTVISSNGNYTLWFETGASGVVSFEPSSDFMGCISFPDELDYPGLFLLKDDYLIEVRDSDSQFLYYEITPTYYHQYVTVVWDITTESESTDPVDPVEFTYGCYILNVYDYCIIEEEMVVNGALSGGSGSTPPSGWFDLPTGATVSWNSNQYSATVTAALQSPRFRNTTPIVPPFGNYELSFEIMSIDPGITVQATFDNGVFTSSAFTTTGVKTLSIPNYDPDNYVDGYIRIFVLANGGPYPATAVIDNVSLVRVEPFQATYRSDCWQYKEVNQNTRLFQGYCDEPALGFDFVNTGFKLSERLVCRSFAPYHEKDKRIYNYGSGRSGTYYSEDTKWFGVYLDAVPETVHDTMAVMLDTDHFSIGVDEYQLDEYVAKPDDYVPEWDRSGVHSLATVRFEVKPKEDGQVFSRNC